MPDDFLLFALMAWCAAALLALCGYGLRLTRGLLVLGGVVLLPLAAGFVPDGDSLLPRDGGWLMGFGLIGAIAACWQGTPSERWRTWVFGAAASLTGALGVFVLQDAVGFLIAWEIMSLGGAVMLLGESLSPNTGRSVLFMLGLLEAGSVALLVGILLLSVQADSLSFADFPAAALAMPDAERLIVGVLFLVGFGAKLGVLPFYEWFPGAYGIGSGATGAILSGVVLNAAFFGLSRVLLHWFLPAGSGAALGAGIFVMAIGVVSAILTALYAFQREDWRELLSLSSAENASVAVCLLGAMLLFRQDGLSDLAGLAWLVAHLHLAGHALAKGALFLTADGVYHVTGTYRIRQRGTARGAWLLGVGALLAAMSLAAMPPQAGFVSEWYLFQTVFQGFHLHSLAGRLTMVLAGGGLALTAAVAFAVFVKLYGIGLLGRRFRHAAPVPWGISLAVGGLGAAVLVLAVGMPWWLRHLSPAVVSTFGGNMTAMMRDHWLLVPLTAKFAFISPTMLVIAMPLLALVPIGLLAVSMRRPVRAVAVWYGGRERGSSRAVTTALTFSNALRTFYSFIYRPTATTERELSGVGAGRRYFTKRLVFSHDVAPIFGPYLFAPLEHFVLAVARHLRRLQSGHLNFYLSLVGGLLVAILLIALF
ncbi:hydrogenase-4 component B [mine drainage metagenome]|uniref:Hydrogenase-4 component B n=1 Tax=mine drainage metagenome TaxID=410659 RepID=A0A1J5R3N5_9ZZZZ